MKNIYLIIEIITFFATATFAQDSYEPNNTFSQATEISLNGGNITAYIQEYDDVDYYKIIVPESGVLKIIVSDVSPLYAAHLYLYDVDQSNIIAKRTNTINGQLNSIEASICDNGTYYIRINSGSSSRFDKDKPYTLQVDYTKFSTIDKFECNNSFSEAAIVESGKLNKAIIAPYFDNNSYNTDKDFDYYKLNITEPGLFKFDIAKVPGDLSLDLVIYDPSQSNVIYSNYNALEGQAFKAEVSACEIGEYYFVIYNSGTWGNYNSSDQYEFTTTFIPFSEIDKFECNNSFSEAAIVESGILNKAIIAPYFDNQSYNSDKDFDYYKMNITEPGLFNFDIAKVPGDLSLDLVIYDPSQSNVIYSYYNAPEGQAFKAEVSACEIGEYYFVIYNSGTWGNYNSSEQYEFTTTFIPFSEIDPTECNNSPLMAFTLSLCEKIEGMIVPSFDYSGSNSQKDFDYYSLNVGNDTNKELTIDATEYSLLLTIEIFDPNNQIIEFESFIQSKFKYDFTNKPNGKYILKVSSLGLNFDIESTYKMDYGCLPNGTNENKIQPVNIYPNPFTSQFNIDTNLNNLRGIQIYDVSGALEPFTREGQEINLENSPNGIYYVKLLTSGGTIFKKIVKI